MIPVSGGWDMETCDGVWGDRPGCWRADMSGSASGEVVLRVDLVTKEFEPIAQMAYSYPRSLIPPIDRSCAARVNA